jgi:Fic family protein
MLRGAGLKETAFIAMSNYYYDEKTAYLNSLNAVRAADNDLSQFFIFGLKGIEKQCLALFGEIRTNIAKALYRDTMVRLFQRLRSPKKRVIGKRQLAVANLLLDRGETEFEELVRLTAHEYKLKNPRLAIVRDLNSLMGLGAISIQSKADPNGGRRQFWLDANLAWPTVISETEFFQKTRELPKGKTLKFLTSDS